MKFKLINILIMFFIVSCKTIPCVTSNPIINFIGFSEPQADSVVLKKYAKNSGFHNLIDSIIITKNNSVYEQTSDTLHIVTSIEGDYSLDIQFDYEVYLPIANKVFQLSNFVQQQTEMNAGLTMDKTQCINPITSYTLNGQVISGKPDYHILYLNK